MLNGYYVAPRVSTVLVLHLNAHPFVIWLDHIFRVGYRAALHSAGLPCGVAHKGKRYTFTAIGYQGVHLASDVKLGALRR